jgi:DNA (cytosine-5)-methyltransferase 1
MIYKIIENHPQDSRVKYREDGVFQTLSSKMGQGGGNVPMVQTIAIEGNGSRPSHKGNGYKETDKMYTLNTTEVHGVAYSMGHDERSAQFTPNKTDPLTASDYKQPTIISEPKIAGTLSATFYKGAGNNSVDACLWPDSKANTVRRLTPLECERLQGLPDSWTDVEFNGKPAPDSKRYKAIGNGMAVPCSDFIMRRIAEVSNGQNEGHD